MSLTPDVEVAAIGAISSIVVGALVLIGVAIQSRKTRDKVEDVRVLAEPTGNGYADKTLAALARIEDRQILTDQRADREAIAREKLAAELAAYREQYARDHPIPQQSHPVQEDAT